VINIYLIEPDRKTTVVANVATELVYHFTCPKCGDSWSMSDFNFNLETTFCPSCGTKYGVFVTHARL